LLHVLLQQNVDKQSTQGLGQVVLENVNFMTTGTDKIKVHVATGQSS
jgi:hypothetical protein